MLIGLLYKTKLVTKGYRLNNRWHAEINLCHGFLMPVIFVYFVVSKYHQFAALLQDWLAVVTSRCFSSLWSPAMTMLYAVCLWCMIYAVSLWCVLYDVGCILYDVFCMMYAVCFWCMIYALCLWCMLYAYDVWCMLYSVCLWCMLYSVCYMLCAACCMSLLLTNLLSSAKRTYVFL